MADKAVLRLLDANLNRCREGLRVLEDTSRFVRNDARFFRVFRGLRHQLDALTRRLYPSLVDARESGGDQGRMVKEGGRADAAALITANFRRCEESLRVLEEYGKLFSAAAGREFKKIRFAVYKLEKDAQIKWKLRRVKP